MEQTDKMKISAGMLWSQVGDESIEIVQYSTSVYGSNHHASRRPGCVANSIEVTCHAGLVAIVENMSHMLRKSLKNSLKIPKNP
jgi:hypothetical protein